MTSTECTNWLADYQLTGAYHADAGQHRTCANCGQGIANIAVATHRHTPNEQPEPHAKPNSRPAGQPKPPPKPPNEPP
jgi:hypothetical protein